MFKISQIIFQNPNGEFLVYLRDNDMNIPFPNTWDLIGGHVEKGEIPLVALVREVKEEIGYDLMQSKYWNEYVCLSGDISPNIKYIYHGIIDLPLESITLTEGQELKYVTAEEINNMEFANVIKTILNEFIRKTSQ
jgi:8-oxo-dGTP pyrophosphatase MutT (NUDIX family)